MLNFSKINIFLIYIIFFTVSIFSILNFQDKDNQIIEKKFSVAEGVFTVRALKKLSIEKKLDLPINDAIYKVLYRKKNIDVTIQELLSRPITKE